LLALEPNDDDDMLLAIIGTMAGLEDETEGESAAFLIGDAKADEDGSEP
jgi:hypothetical protein